MKDLQKDLRIEEIKEEIEGINNYLNLIDALGEEAIKNSKILAERYGVSKEIFEKKKKKLEKELQNLLG